jgi:hypothetical protein
LISGIKSGKDVIKITAENLSNHPWGNLGVKKTTSKT